jgi:hypothetical protein
METNNQDKMATKENIIETLHSQFAENQNHHQSLFIQFLIALLALFAGFGYVYTHTNPDIIYSQSFVQRINKVDYFSNQTLLATSTVVLAVLLLLNGILINQGYGFRRDQHLNMKIRRKYLGDDYKSVFDNLYNSDNKGFWDYLPNFYTIFFWFIFGFQVSVIIAICTKEGLVNFLEKCLALKLFIMDIILILLSLFFYCKTYCKYKINLKEKKT